jgi:hypothetical protein
VETERSWTEDYALLHYAWAPEDLDHLSNPKRETDRKRKSPTQTVAALRRLEVPFNHILAFFFSLAPSLFVAQLFEVHTGVEPSGDLKFRGREFERRFRIDTITQPDFVFEGDRAFLTIETKIDSKSSIEQLQKYAFLHSAVQQTEPGREHGLLLLTPYPERDLFRGNISSVAAARQMAAADLRSDGAIKWSIKKIAESKAVEMLEDSNALRIGHCSFGQFAERMSRFSDIAIPDSIEMKLYRGLLNELGRRKLTPALS